MNGRISKFLRRQNIPGIVIEKNLYPIHGPLVESNEGYYFKNSPFSSNVEKMLRRFWTTLSPKQKKQFKKEVVKGE